MEFGIGCCCSCVSMFTPGDALLREQWLYGASLKLDNNPIQESLTAPFAIQIDGLPDGPKTLPGGPRAFGPSAPGAPSTGWGYFNVNPNSVRFITLCNWPDMYLTSFEPLSLIMRADHPYPDEDLHDKPSRPHVPWRFFSSAITVCQTYSGYEHVVHKADIVIGEIPTATKTIGVTFNDMYFRPTGFYIDRVQLYKFFIEYMPLIENVGYVPSGYYIPKIHAVYFNSAMGPEAVPIVNVPRSECVFNPQPPLIATYRAYSDTIWPVERMRYLSYLDAWATVNVRDNLLPGYKITVPKIGGDPHVGRTVEDSIDIYTIQTFDTGHWIVKPTIAHMKCDAQLCHYYHIPYSSSSGYTNSVVLSPPDNGRIGNEAILPLSGGPVVGKPFYRQDQPRVGPGRGFPVEYEDFLRDKFITSDPTTGCFAFLRSIPRPLNPDAYNLFEDESFVTNGDGTFIWSCTMRGQNALPITFDEVADFLASFNSGDIITIPRTLVVPSTFPNTRILAGISFAFAEACFYQVPAFLGEQDVTYTYEPHSTRLDDRSRDITTLAAQKPNSQIPADGYEHVITEAERALYRLPADPVTIPLEPLEIVHAKDTYVGPATAVVDGLAVCFSTSWGGFNPNYIYPPNNSGPFKTETHSVGTATMVREQYT